MATTLDEMAELLDGHERVRRDLVADVAHELRTPVAVLQAGHEALLDGIAEPTPEQLSSLRDEVLRLARMVDDLQLLAAADAAALQLARSPCDLSEVAATAADSLAGQFEMAGISVERHLAPAATLADPRWMHNLVTNLLTNALKFSAPGGKVVIDTETVGSDAVVHVTDTGIGIPAAELPRIFDRFWRGQQAAHTSGSGIGLAIAAELARAHGGSPSAERAGRRHEITLHAESVSTLMLTTLMADHAHKRTTSVSGAAGVLVSGALSRLDAGIRPSNCLKPNTPCAMRRSAALVSAARRVATARRPAGGATGAAGRSATGPDSCKATHSSVSSWSRRAAPRAGPARARRPPVRPPPSLARLYPAVAAVLP
jgi:hypothetical protein